MRPRQSREENNLHQEHKQLDFKEPIIIQKSLNKISLKLSFKSVITKKIRIKAKEKRRPTFLQPQERDVLKHPREKKRTDR